MPELSGKNGNPKFGLARRDLLKASPLTLLSCCIPFAAKDMAAEDHSADSSKRDPAYRQTDLIRKYYDRARF